MLRRRTDIGIYLSPTAILVCQTTSSWFNKKKKDVTFPLVFVYFKEDITKGYSYAATYQEDGTLLTLEDSCQEMKLPTLFDDLATAVKNVLPKEISHFPRTLMFMDQKYSVLEPQIVSWLNFLARRSFTSTGEVTKENTVAAALLTKQASCFLFVPKDPKEIPKENVILRNLPFTIYMSRDALGLIHIRKKILKPLEGTWGNILETSCVSPNAQFEWTYKSTKYTVRGAAPVSQCKGAVSKVVYTDCSNAVEAVVYKFLKAPCLEGKEFFALLDYEKIAKAANLITSENGGSVKLSDVKKKAVEVCARDTDHPQFLCMDLVYMHTLFKWKYNIQDETIVHEVKGMLQGLMDNIGKVLPEEEWCNTRVLSYTEEVFTTVPKSHLSDLANYMTTFFYCKGFCVEGTRPLAQTNIRSQLVMGWLALNYALGRGEVEAKNSVAAALLVEKARALVFVPPKLTGKECGCPFMDIGLPFKIYAYSDSIGKNKIRRSIVLSSTDVKECEETKASCLRPLSLKVYSNRTEFLSKEPTIDYKKCKNAIETLVRNYNKPMSFQGRKFYALNSYYEFAIRANLIGENGGNVPLAQIEKKAKQICENNNDDDFLCMDLIYMYVLFKQNYGLKDRCEVHFYKEVNGFELNWRIAKAFSLYKEYNLS
ncbi:hypothetical protein RUM44_000128 [Polyplax serrata]|uniref:Uncharacterized protein n=1 Tax=Polyplax serrata TaxID=468196 RepID=A0ABR1B4J7_POLSC